MSRWLFVTICFAVPFVISLSYPFALLTYLPKRTHPERWIQNNPSISIFLFSAFPMAVAIFAASVSPLALQHWSAEVWHFRIACVAIPTSIVIASMLVIDDFRRRPMAPYVLKAHLASEVFRLERELRTAAKKNLDDKKLAQKQSKYRRLIRIRTLKDFRTKAGPIAYIHIALSWMGTLFAVCYFWYLIAAAEYKVYHHADLGRTNENRLILILILLVTWFPMRLHTEWYQNYFHKRNWLSGYPAFWVLAFLAMTALIMVGILIKPEGLLHFIPIFHVVFLAVLGIIGKFKPEWLRTLADFLESLPFIYFLAIYLIFFVIISVTTSITILNPAP